MDAVITGNKRGSEGKVVKGFETAFNTGLPDGSILGATATITALNVATSYLSFHLF